MSYLSFIDEVIRDRNYILVIFKQRYGDNIIALLAYSEEHAENIICVITSGGDEALVAERVFVDNWCYPGAYGRNVQEALDNLNKKIEIFRDANLYKKFVQYTDFLNTFAEVPCKVEKIVSNRNKPVLIGEIATELTVYLEQISTLMDAK